MRLIALLFYVTLSGAAMAQTLLHQPTNTSTPATMPQGILDQLDDPFFNIVIQGTPQPLTLTDSLDLLLQGGRSDFQSFVVDEQIGRPETVTSDCGSALHRMVVSLTGTHAPTSTVLNGNVFLSVFLTPTGPVGDVEVLAWDNTNQAYNYYKLEGGTWRLRNRSTDLQTETPDELADGCLACHVNAAPVMKEFTFPWNNWHGLPNTFEADYLRPGAQGWPVATTGFLGQRFAGAQSLEGTIQSSIQRFAGVLIEKNMDIAADGSVVVNGLTEMLNSLFKPTELNLGSSNTKSGLDGGGLTQPAVRPMNIPDSFFINIIQMRDIDLPLFASQGLVTEIFTPGDLGVSLSEYDALLQEFDIDTDCQPGRDTLFTWFGPEPSEFDRRMIERLNRRGILDDGFVAAVLAVDIETPLFSEARASLQVHAPERISAPSRGQLPDALREAVIDSLEAQASRSDVEEDFLGLLKGGVAVEELDRRARDYLTRTQEALGDPMRRDAHLQELFARLISNRNAFGAADISDNLNEFPGLLPQD